MNKKLKYTTTSFLMAMLFSLSACSDDTGQLPVPPEPVVDGYSLLNISIRNDKKASTYALGTFEAYPQEKEIRSVAFFTQTDDVGKFGDPGFLPGAFNKYFSTEELRSVNGLHEPLEESNGNYTVGVRIKSEGFGANTRVIVIANYDENGLTTALRNVRNWEDLKYVLTPEIRNEHLHTPVVMFGTATVPLTNGGTENATIHLYRMVSRLDVVNQAAVPAEPEKGFVLHSAQLLHPKEFGFLLPGNQLSAEIPTIASLPEVKAANLPESDPTKITGLYVYETDNSGTKSEKTRILVKGLLFDTPFEREIALKKPDEPGKDGDPIPLQRNYLYQLVITGIVGTDINWNIQIVDWNDGTNINVPPTLAKPLITEVTFANDGDEGRWDPDTHTYTYDGKTAEIIRFTAIGLHATTYGFHCELEGRGESIGLDNPDHPNRQRFIKREAAELEEDATVSQVYEITLPTVLNLQEYAVPVDIKLYIQNSANYYYADTITVRCRPDYQGTQYQPVILAGIYWAPVNVGATSTDAFTVRNLANVGYYFQWGRNDTKFSIDETYSTTPAAVTLVYKDVKEGRYNNIFITGGDWLQAGDPGIPERNKLWNSDAKDFPCPKGWRVPTRQELDALKPRYYATYSNVYRFRSDESEKELLIPCGGLKHQNNGVAPYNTIAYLWSSEISGALAIYWGADAGGTVPFQTATTTPCHGMSIRCVQATTPTP